MKMVAIVVCLQHPQTFVNRNPLLIGQLLYLRHEIILYLLFRYAAYPGKVGCHGNVP